MSPVSPTLQVGSLPTEPWGNLPGIRRTPGNLWRPTLSSGSDSPPKRHGRGPDDSRQTSFSYCFQFQLPQPQLPPLTASHGPEHWTYPWLQHSSYPRLSPRPQCPPLRDSLALGSPRTAASLHSTGTTHTVSVLSLKKEHLPAIHSGLLPQMESFQGPNAGNNINIQINQTAQNALWHVAKEMSKLAWRSSSEQLTTFMAALMSPWEKGCFRG